MTRWPFDDVLWRAIEGPEYELDTRCANQECERMAKDRHHVASRSQLGKASAWVTNEEVVLKNLVPLCRFCHSKVTDNRSFMRYKDGKLFYDDLPIREVEVVAKTPEGAVCVSCDRRKPFKKKSTTPTTKQFHYHCPVDDAGVHEEILAAVADKLGSHDVPYWKWSTITKACVVVLQVP